MPNSIADKSTHPNTWSTDYSNNMLSRSGWNTSDYLLLMLNSHFEYRIGHVLRSDHHALLLAWAEGMLATIAGEESNYWNWHHVREHAIGLLRGELLDNNQQHSPESYRITHQELYFRLRSEIQSDMYEDRYQPNASDWLLEMEDEALPLIRERIKFLE